MYLLQVVLNEMGTRCRTGTTRDWKTITGRIKHEGLSFLTITLPAFCSDLQKGLSDEHVSPSLFVGFSKSGELPRFLGGFLDLVFDRKTGRLLHQPDIDAIQAIRQITLLFSKVLLPCSDTRRERAFKKFMECEQQIKANDAAIDPYESVAFKQMSIRLFGDVFSRVDSDIFYGRIVPKHGPGTTAERVIRNDKYNHLQWTARLERYFPHGEFLFPSWSHFREASEVDLFEPGSETPVRVVSVPKTLKTPRIIAIEPVCMQFVQQGILESLLASLERDDILSRVIGFDDQLPNQEMARIGSQCGNLATLDLSEASDRVSNQLVRDLLSSFPHLREGVEACRSRKADVPGFGVHRLAKFASMGSALCFPFEAMVFTTICFLGIQEELKRQLTRSDFYRLRSQVRVYGDDIIVPVEFVRSVVRKLQTFGFVVNSEKSFWTGSFRESCGKEYYDGHDVSVVKVRRLLPAQRRHVPEIISLVSTRNQFYWTGMWETCKFLDSYLERLIPFPIVSKESQALGRQSALGVQPERICSKLHRPLVRAYVVSNRIPKSNLEGPGALLKCFLKRGEEPIADRRHLERAGRPEAVDIKLRWVLAD